MDRREEVPFNHVLSREEQQTVAPPLTDVTPIALEVDMPLERLFFVHQNVRPIRVLVKEKLRVVNLPPKDQVRHRCTSLSTLCVELRADLCKLMLIFFRGL